MGDPAMYPEIRAARNVYALQRLPSDFSGDVQARKQWVDNNLTYLDGPRIRANSLSPTRHPHRAWFSPLSMRCLRPCTPPVRLFSVYSLRVQPSIRHGARSTGTGHHNASVAARVTPDLIPLE
eukprot:scaffold14932_cov133-Isochrysis_galbana.AAC.5